MVTVALALLIAAATGSVSAVDDSDHAADLTAVLKWLAHLFSGMTWPVVTCLIAVSICHHVAASIAARAAAATPLPFLELVGAQYVAAAANRVAPAGLGSAGVTGRFMTRRGRLSTTQATAAVSALALLGALADVAAFGCLIGVGSALSLTGATGEAPRLVSHLTGLVPMSGAAARYLVIGVAALLTVTTALLVTRKSAMTHRLVAAVRDFGRSLLEFARNPLRLMSVIAASAATTLILAAGFAAVAIIGPTQLPPSHFAAFMIGYMLAAGAANALPTPGGIGTADAALTGVLLTAHSPMSAVVATVLAYRLVTFWAPAAVGVVLLRPLRIRGAI
jgi:uncharacterized membrane protein YbhN (UPF0104 family)